MPSRAVDSRALDHASLLQQIRIMPDVHAGKGCTIGATMTITDRVVPNLVGVDIGCGMLVTALGKAHIEFSRLDKVIRECVPGGKNIRSSVHPYIEHTDIEPQNRPGDTEPQGLQKFYAGHLYHFCREGHD